MKFLHDIVETEGRQQPKFPGFRSCVTTEAIKYQKRYVHDLLLQLSLDASVVAISPYDDELPAGAVFGCLVQHACGQSVVVMASVDRIDVTSLQGVPVVCLTRADIRAEPRRTTARLVWSGRRAEVTPGDRLRLLDALSKAAGGLALAEAAAVLRTVRDPVAGVCRLACDGLIAVDIGGALTGETRVVVRNKPGSQSRHEKETTAAQRFLALHGHENQK